MLLLNQACLTPGEGALQNLNCSLGFLPLTYLGVLITRGKTRRQDWKKLIAGLDKGYWIGRPPFYLFVGGSW